jgi:hypothetical protein
MPQLQRLILGIATFCAVATLSAVLHVTGNCINREHNSIRTNKKFEIEAKNK